MVVNATSYGAIPVDGVRRRFATKLSPARAVRLSLVALLATAALITLIALARGPTVKSGLRTWLVQTKTKLSIEPSGAEGASLDAAAPSDFHPPTDSDVASFKDAATAVFSSLKVKPEETDLPEACGVALYPCAAKIAGCALRKITPTQDGKLTPTTSVCNCFVLGFTESIPLPSSADEEISCSFKCVDTILKYTDQYVVGVNGADNDLSNFCSNSMDIIGHKEFANKDNYIATNEDDASLEVLPIDDPKVALAAEALAEYINTQRTTVCPVLPAVTTNGTHEIVYAKRGIVSGGRSQYRLEVVFDQEVFFARLAHLPKDQQLTDPSERAADPLNLGGRFAVLHSTPEPCGDAIPQQLAVSETVVSAINKQNLPWTAKLHEQLEGRTIASFGLGYKPLPAAERRRYITELDTTDFTPPPAYDARDTAVGQEACKAFRVMDQGGCGSCYAFASAAAYSARMCRFNPGSVGNTVVSPQEMIDCSNGCNGGNPITVYQNMLPYPGVEAWCDPYKQAKDVCGGVCANGNPYTIQAGSVRAVGGSSPDGILQMQLELIRSGPGVVSFDVYDDFHAYSSGVYVRSNTSTKVGAHAVALLGWGELGGVPYWLIQNSWSSNWGMNGFALIRRGTNESGIESEGLTVVKPLPPAVCATAGCKNGASTLKDCTCRCEGGWSGADCGVCALACQNGGVRDPSCTKCACPLGYSGAACEGKLVASPLATCLGGLMKISVDFAFGGTAPPPTQKSFVGIYPVGETRALSPVQSVMLCGTTYNAGLNGGACPGTGGVTLTPPAAAGDYFVALVRFIPPNEFGQSGYSTLLKPSDTIALHTVLPSGCPSADLNLAKARNDPIALLQASAAAAAAAAQAVQDQMNARLAAIQPILAALNAELPASIDILGVTPSTVLWMTGPPIQICFRVPQSKNVNPKVLLLYVGDGSSGSYYPTGLGGGGTDNPLPTTYQGCVTTTFGSGLPSGQYTINMVDVTTSVHKIITGFTFKASQATVRFSSYGYTSTQLSLTVAWTVDSDVASPYDTVKIHNSQGLVTYWFFTSCNCQTAPAAGAPAVPAGSLRVSILKLNSVQGGYTPKLYPAGGDTVAAVGTNWINWAQIGW